MGLRRAALDRMCRELTGRPTYTLRELTGARGVISRYTASSEAALVGHFVADERWVIKAKAPGREVRRRLAETYTRFDVLVAELQRAQTPSLLDDCHIRELAIYELASPAIRALAPAVARVWRDDAAEVYAIAMELLANVRHADTLDDLDAWEPRDIAAVLTAVARVHAEFRGAPPACVVPFRELHTDSLLAYQAELLRYNAGAFPELFDAARVRRLEALLAAAPARWRAIAERPLTLVHGDLTPRNVCLRADGRACAYDWELAQAHLPARDVCEFLCYALRPTAWREDVTAQLLAPYRDELALAIAEFCTFKLLVQGITHQLLGKRRYFERLVHNAFACIEVVS